MFLHKVWQCWTSWAHGSDLYVMMDQKDYHWVHCQSSLSITAPTLLLIRLSIACSKLKLHFRTRSTSPSPSVGNISYAFLNCNLWQILIRSYPIRSWHFGCKHVLFNATLLLVITSSFLIIVPWGHTRSFLAHGLVLIELRHLEYLQTLNTLKTGLWGISQQSSIWRKLQSSMEVVI